MMKAQEFLNQISNLGIEVMAGVPDSTLKQFCDGVQLHGEKFRHYVAANEGAAVGLAVGSYLSSRKPACVYMQNSGIGNIINPLASLAHDDVYGIPMLFVVGWRGEPGVKDEPQHVFQGKVTCELFQTMTVPYSVIDVQTTNEEMTEIFAKAGEHLKKNLQYAIIVKKGTFESADKYTWTNEWSMNREQTLGALLRMVPKDACIVSTTGKISRELYEQSNQIYGNHDNLFMTVGGMGHASMIALGIAKDRPGQTVICVDGDGAALMHMGALAFIASQAPENFYHIVINNQAHESVGSMPTGCQKTEFYRIAKAAGYTYSARLTNEDELEVIRNEIGSRKGPCLYEVMVTLDSRADLCRPKESAKENRDAFMKYMKI